MPDQKHIIKRQVLEFRIDRDADSFALQQEMAAIYNEHIVPLIDHHLSAFSSPESIDRIELLELDLGKLDRNNLQTAFVEQVELQLREKLGLLAGEYSEQAEAFSLEQPITIDVDGEHDHDPEKETTAIAPEREKLNQEPGHENEFRKPEHPENESPEMSSGRSEDPERIKTSGRSRAETDRELLVHYFRTGVFPWWARSVGRVVLEKIVERMLQSDPDAIRQLLPELLQDPIVRKRFVYTFSDTSLLRLIEATVSPEMATAVKRLIAGRKHYFRKYGDRQPERTVAWEEIVEQVLMNTLQLGTVYPYKLLSEVQEILAEVPGREQKTLDMQVFLKDSLQLLERITRVFMLPELEQTVHAGTKTLRQMRQATGKGAVSGKSTASATPKALAETVQQLAATLHHSHSPVTQPNPRMEKTIAAFSNSDKIGVQNAGLLLTWPFLAILFSRLDLLTEEKQFRDRSAAEKACCVLQYLATGSKQAPLEAELPLNKILCGLPLDEPLNTQIQLTKEEMTLANGLLKAMILQHPLWKNLSVEGLRGSFLLREGLLSTRDGNWLLQVKRAPYDILLDSLPWTFQHIKLPWMPTLLAVVW